MPARIRSVLSLATLVFAMSGPIGCATAPGPRPAMATRPLFRGPSPETRETDAQLDSSVRTKVIEGALKQLADNYVFPDVARATGIAILAKGRTQPDAAAIADAGNWPATKPCTARRPHLRHVGRPLLLQSAASAPGGHCT